MDNCLGDLRYVTEGQAGFLRDLLYSKTVRCFLRFTLIWCGVDFMQDLRKVTFDVPEFGLKKKGGFNWIVPISSAALGPDPRHAIGD